MIGEELMMSDTFGPMSRMPFAFYDPEESCWRTSQATFLLDSDRFSATWPKSGMTHAGSAYELPMPALRMVAPASSSLLPTPDAYQGNRGGSQHPDKRREGGHQVSLQDVAEHLLPTPRSVLGTKNTTQEHAARQVERHGYKARLEEAITLLPTPTAQASKHDADDRGPGTLDDYNLWSVAPRLLATPRATRGGSSTENCQSLTGDPSDPLSDDGNGYWDVPLPLPPSPTDEAETA